MFKISGIYKLIIIQEQVQNGLDGTGPDPSIGGFIVYLKGPLQTPEHFGPS